MSGGHFDYNQYRIDQIAEDIEQLIRDNEDETLDEWGSKRGKFYKPEIIAKFKETARTLRRAAAMAQRVDWLVSGDDGPECFLRRWEKEVPK